MEKILIRFKEQEEKETRKLRLEEIKDEFQKNSIPIYFLTDLYKYSKGDRRLVEFFINSYSRKIKSIKDFEDILVDELEKNFDFICVDYMNILITCSLVSKVSFSLFANIVSAHNKSVYSINKIIRGNLIFYEESGYYYYYSFFKRFLDISREKFFSFKSLEKIRLKLIGLIIEENNFNLEYLKLASKEMERNRLEEKVIDCILKYGIDYFGDGFRKYSQDFFNNPTLKVLILLKNENKMNESSINYLVNDFKSTSLFKVILQEYFYYMGKSFKY